MKTKKSSKYILLSFLAIPLLSSCNINGYYISPDFGDIGPDSNNVIHLEYGNSFLLPNATVKDKNGETYDGVSIKRVLTHEDGTIIRSIVPTFEESKNYYLTYTCEEEGFEIPEAKYKIVCKDTLGPKVDIRGVRKLYEVGETLNLGIQSITDASGVYDDASEAYIYKKGVDSAVYSNLYLATNPSINYSFTEEGEYTLKISAEDSLGNKSQKIYEFSVTDSIEICSEDNFIWKFRKKLLYL